MIWWTSRDPIRIKHERELKPLDLARRDHLKIWLEKNWSWFLILEKVSKIYGLNATYVHACPQILVKIDPWAKRRINFSIEFFLQSDHILYDFRVKFCNESKYYVKIQTFSHLKINKINIFLKKLLLPLYLI